MKKLFLTLAFFCLFMTSVGLAYAQTVTPTNGVNPNTFCTGGKCTYVPLEPLYGLPNTYGPDNSFASLIPSIFKLLIGAGAVVAVVMIVLGALTYMFSDIVGNKKKALDRIRGAMWAIVLLVSSYLILVTINPDLVKFSLNLNVANNFTTNSNTTGTTLQTQAQQSPAATTPNNTITTGTVNSGVQQAICGSSGSCNTWGEYMVYDPNSTSLDVQLARDRFVSNCETTHSDSQNIYAASQGRVALFPASTVGGGNLTGAACVLQ